MTQIDIVIPWVNPADSKWFADFSYWKTIETGDTCIGRFRDCNTIKYVLRSIEENCPWCRNVFLLLASPSQIPEWLNTHAAKLKIIYHADFIPSRFLPTFNSSLINIFVPDIPGLGRNYIFCNDDTFFTQLSKPEFFFINDKPVYKISQIGTNDNSDFGMLIQQDITFLSKVLNAKTNPYDTFHLPTSYNKEIAHFTKFLLSDFLDDIFGNSKFRQRKNINEYIYFYAAIHLNYYISNSATRGCFYFFTEEMTHFDMKYPMVCINERGDISSQAIQALNDGLEHWFSKKSSFEK